MIKRIGVILLLTSCFAPQVFAEKSNYIRFAGFIPFTQEGTLQMRENGLGASLDLNDALHLKPETQVFRLDGYYRFNPKHRIDYTYYSLKSDGTASNKNAIDIGDETLAANASLDSELNIDILKLNYTYSFYHKDKVELGLSAGIHTTQFKTKIEAEGTLVGQSSETTATRTEANITAPLPVIGWRLHYDVIKDLQVTFSYDLFAISIEDFKGSYLDSQLILDYKVYDEFGIGAGLNRTAYNLSATDGGTKVKFNRALLGGMLFVSYGF